MPSLRTAIALALGGSLGIGGAALAHAVLPETPLVRGIFIGERCAPPGAAAEAWLARRHDEALGRAAHLRHGDASFDVTLEEIGVEIDVAATLEQARAIGHEGTVWRRLREAREARAGAVDVPLVWRVDGARAAEKLGEIAPALAREPVDARLDLSIPAKIPEVPGRTLDVASSVEQIARGTHDDEETLELITREVPARVSVMDLVRVDVDKVVSSYETTFVTFGTGAGRAVNIRNAASKIDGVVLMPDQVFSFNDRVGPRSLANGFTLAPEIQGDELQTGVGGGTCQVSSTLHAAVLFGALRVVERQGHSRPSSYTKLGLDATVSYPTTDLKIQNTLPYPIMIHAYLPRATAIHVDLLGGDPVARVDYTYGVGASEDFVRRIHVKEGFPPGKRVRHQKGSRGYDVTSIVTVRFLDGRIEERRYFSGYRPAPEVFWVAPGYDESELPPLPEHAKGVEGRLSSSEATDDVYAYPM